MTTEYPPLRAAKITYRTYAEAHADLDAVRAYLPSNFSAYVATDGSIVVLGNDSAGWTLEDYVIPRLASGMRLAREVSIGTMEAGQ